MRILVTGATGFIGRHLLPLLVREGHEVHATTSSGARGTSLLEDVFWHEVDLLDQGRSAKLIQEIAATHLIHLAWYTNPEDYWTARVNITWALASLGLLVAFQESGGRRAVFAGSCAEYDWKYGLCREVVTPCYPASIYGKSKLHLGALCAELSAASGMSLAWARVFHLYGPGEPARRLVPSTIRSILAGQLASCLHAYNSRDFLYVEDVASAFAAVLRSDLSGVVNIGSGEATQIGAVVSRIGDLMGRRELVRLSAPAESRSNDSLVFADNSKLAQETGWQQAHCLDEGLQATIKWWRETV